MRPMLYATAAFVLVLSAFLVSEVVGMRNYAQSTFDLLVWSAVALVGLSVASRLKGGGWRDAGIGIAVAVAAFGAAAWSAAQIAPPLP